MRTLSFVIFIMLISSGCFAQSLTVDSLIRIEDSLGNVFFQKYQVLEVTTAKQDSASYVDSLWTLAHNNYLPATRAKEVLLNLGQYNAGFNAANADLIAAGTSYWDVADVKIGMQFTGLWRITNIDTQEDGFYDCFVANGRILLRQIDAVFSRDSTGQRFYSGAFSAGSTNHRLIFRNQKEFRNLSLDTSPIDVVFFREVPNDDLVGTTRLVYFDTGTKWRFIFFRDIKKQP